MKITNFHYANATFEKPAEFVEYPKWIHMSGYPSEIVQDREGEDRLLARASVSGDIAVTLEPAVSVAVAAAPGDDGRAALLQIAKEKNIKVDARWKTDRIRETIEKAG